MHFQGPGVPFVSRRHVLHFVREKMDATEVMAVSSNRSQFEWFLTFGHEDSKKEFLGLLTDSTAFLNGHLFSVTCATKRLVNLRVHWLPVWIRDEFLKHYFENVAECGKVMDVKFEKEEDEDFSHVFTGVRKVLLECTREQLLQVRHVAKFMNYEFLITYRGRAPYCLKCGMEGHERRFCSQRGRRRTYAGVAASRPNMEEGEAASRPTTTTATETMTGLDTFLIENPAQRWRQPATDAVVEEIVDEVSEPVVAVSTEETALVCEMVEGSVSVGEDGAVEPVPSPPEVVCSGDDDPMDLFSSGVTVDLCEAVDMVEGVSDSSKRKHPDSFPLDSSKVCHIPKGVVRAAKSSLSPIAKGKVKKKK